ncbi:MAG: HTTM domain-containing protein [Bdellovibrionales bacterium]|nr:HTTM domain-containing protein [Bdellovibrionales bacterium]
MKKSLKQFEAYLRSIFSVDVRSLALFRITLGLILLIDLVDRLRFMRVFYTDEGAVPRHVVLEYFQGKYLFSIFFLTGDEFTLGVLFAMNILLCIGLILGFRTRLMTVLCWIFSVSITNRASVITYGGDVVLRMILFWSMFVPLGLTYSVDAALSSQKYKVQKYFSSGTFGLMIQFLFVYMFAALYKHDPVWIPEGTAIAYTLELDQFATHLGIWLRQFPIVLKALTFGTLAIELFGPFLLLSPMVKEKGRLLIIMSFVGMHLGIFALMNVGLFSWMCIAVWPLFLPSLFWDFWKKRSKKTWGEGFVLYFDQNCGFCQKAMRIIHIFSGLSSAKVEPAQSHPQIFEKMEKENSWVVQTPFGQFTKYKAFLQIVQASPIFCIFLPLLQSKPIAFMGEKIYHWVSNNRKTASLLTKPLSYRDHISPTPKAQPWVVAVLFIYVLLYNLGGIDWQSPWLEKHIRQPEFFWPVSNFLRLDQNWGMFAPKPSTQDGWYIIHARTKDGRDVNLWTTDIFHPYEQPKYVAGTFIMHRWNKYLSNLLSNNHQKYLEYFAKYLCRSNNQKREGDDQIDILKIKFIEEQTSISKPYERFERLMWVHYCFGKPEPLNLDFQING